MAPSLPTSLRSLLWHARVEQIESPPSRVCNMSRVVKRSTSQAVKSALSGRSRRDSPLPRFILPQAFAAGREASVWCAEAPRDKTRRFSHGRARRQWSRREHFESNAVLPRLVTSNRAFGRRRSFHGIFPGLVPRPGTAASGITRLVWAVGAQLVPPACQTNRAAEPPRRPHTKKPRASVGLDCGAKRAWAGGQELSALNTKTRPHTIYSIKSP
jgi:hypothetical protein